MLEVAIVTRRGSFDLNAQFELPTPGVAALFGRSGCGKSTIVNVIAGLLRPVSGHVRLDGAPLLDCAANIDMPAERRRIGYVFQDARLFPHLSVADNLRYGQKRARGAAYVTFDGIAALLDLAPLMRRRTHQLSGGERQRVAIGRALLCQPQLLLLDEPLAALDDARREEVLPYLESLRDRLRIPMVYVTHDFSEVLRLATHIVLMETGTVVAQGTVAQMSMDARLRSIIGPDEVGAIVQGIVEGLDAAGELTRVRIGNGAINVPSARFAAGTAVRVQLLARDVILSTESPRRLSVRNSLAGRVTQIQSDVADSELVTVDIGGVSIMARITRAATRDLGLRPGTAVWALVKSVSLRGHAFPDGA